MRGGLYMQENISVSGVLCSSYDSFFEAEKKIADYILAHKSEMIDMTVAELALASGTSDATVSRFCRRCGFNGFHHLKINLAKEIAEGILLRYPMISAETISPNLFKIYWQIKLQNSLKPLP
jgi:DNA-binding MurR/RpiR family transcriptional regulator